MENYQEETSRWDGGWVAGGSGKPSNRIFTECQSDHTSPGKGWGWEIWSDIQGNQRL